jgi:hypothetical protein
LDVSVGDFDFIKLHVLAEMTWREALSLASARALMMRLPSKIKHNPYLKPSLFKTDQHGFGQF